MNTPVALFVFNRPALTRLAVQRLAALQPSRLLVVADGPRSESEAPLCLETRAALREGITWEADVEFLESEVNLGCRLRFETGLDWVFERVDRAIILEDDIEVSPVFFDVASKGLERFFHAPEVRMISGHNVLVDYPEEAAPFLSRTGSIWGWATWADRWQRYRREFPRSTDDEVLGGIVAHAASDVHARLQSHLFESRMWEKIDTWDMPWSIWGLASGGLCLNLPRNQSVNHGIGRDATHTTIEDDLRGRLPVRHWVPDDDALQSPPLRLEYDRAFSLLGLVLNYDEPRRWKVLARRRDRLPSRASGPGWEVMLSPFDHPEETAALIDHLRRHLPDRQLDLLAEVFPPGNGPVTRSPADGPTGTPTADGPAEIPSADGPTKIASAEGPAKIS